MRRFLALALLVGSLGLATSLATAKTVDYDWEDSNSSTILGSYGNLVDPLNVTTGDDNGTTVTPLSGSRMLQVTEQPHGGTPQAYLAFIEGLNDGDTITASFWGWDVTPGATSGDYPSLRVWGHYADSGAPNSYRGSASGNETYTADGGDPNQASFGNWWEVSHTWSFEAQPDPNYTPRDALVVEARLYSTPTTDENGTTNFWIDNLSVTAPEGATITVPGSAPEILLGDVVTDGVLDDADVTAFLDLLLNGPWQDEADMNRDGLVDGEDVQLFIDAVRDFNSGGGAMAIPEPSTVALLLLAVTVLWLRRRRLRSGLD